MLMHEFLESSVTGKFAGLVRLRNVVCGDLVTLHNVTEFVDDFPYFLRVDNKVILAIVTDQVISVRGHPLHFPDLDPWAPSGPRESEFDLHVFTPLVGFLSIVGLE
jgi:hypothetical protein